MAKSKLIRRFPVISERVENWKLQKYKGTLQNSHDFKEITLAITLMAGIGAILLKIVDYFANNVVNIPFQKHLSLLVSILLFIFFIIFIFLILKGYLASQEKGSKKIKNITNELFKYIFVLSIILFFILISGIIISLITNNILRFLFSILFAILNYTMLFYLADGINFIAFISKGKFSIFVNLNSFRFFAITSILIVYLSIFIVPQHLLLGSFSIEELHQSDRYNDIMTVKITETGIPYNSNYIYLYKMNIDTHIFQYIDNITINNTQEALSQKKLMRGITPVTGIWYLNVDSSNLSSGNYMLHTEVTDDTSKGSIFGQVTKQRDKLFYIPPRIADYSSISTK